MTPSIKGSLSSPFILTVEVFFGLGFLSKRLKTLFYAWEMLLFSLKSTSSMVMSSDWKSFLFLKMRSFGDKSIPDWPLFRNILESSKAVFSMYSFTFLSIALVASFFFTWESVSIYLSKYSRSWFCSSWVFFGAFLITCSKPQELHFFLLMFKNWSQSGFLHCLKPLLHTVAVEAAFDLTELFPLFFSVLVFFRAFF